jgi:hypothetical protein
MTVLVHLTEELENAVHLMCASSESVSNEVQESDLHFEKQDKERI